jgi:hypothetical protein
LPVLSDALGLLRFARGVQSFLREPLTVDAAKAFVRDRMARREEIFLGGLERTVYGYPGSPYLQLLREARCELGDVRSLVAREGLDGGLRRLREAGVYVTYEEFKGRQPAVRGGRTFSFRDSDFNNPRVQRQLWGSSGGTSGRPTRVPMSLDHTEQIAPHWALWFAAHGWIGKPVVFWTPFYTGVLNRQLMCAKFRSPFVRWLSTGRSGSSRDRLASECAHALVRWSARFPKPEHFSNGEEAKVAIILRDMAGEGEEICVITSPSAAVRASVAMQERGWRLDGVNFLLGSEPLTPARKAAIEASGARAVPTYGFSEGSSLGSQCPNAGVADDVHVSLDAFALIPRSRNEIETAESFSLTSLRAACPKIMLNAEIGDSAIVENRRCGCLFDELGYYQHIHTIRSTLKLTAEGTTILTSDLYPILEEILPAKFGGAPGDYQLVEEQSSSGLTRYALLVNPSVGAVEDQMLSACFLESLAKLRGEYRLMTRLWAESRVISVRRESPRGTSRGKVLPFQVWKARG